MMGLFLGEGFTVAHKDSVTTFGHDELRATRRTVVPFSYLVSQRIITILTAWHSIIRSATDDVNINYTDIFDTTCRVCEWHFQGPATQTLHPGLPI